MADQDDRFNRGTERHTHPEGMHPLHEERKQGPNWLWLLVPLILGLLVLPNMFRGDNQRATDTSQEQATINRDNVVTFNNERWIVSGNPQTFAEGRMRQVGTSADGQALYEDTQAGGGGGVGTTVQRLYLRAEDGRFIPLVRD